MKYDIFQTLFISMQLLLIAPTSNCIAAYTVTEPERNLNYFQDEFQDENEIDYYYSNYGYEADLECCLTLPAFEEEIGDDEFLVRKGFSKPAHVPQEAWDACAPYFIPMDHPIKSALDQLFGAYPRAISSSKSLANAGFKNTKPGKWSGTIVCRHRKVKGYFIKLYTDDQLSYQDWTKLTNRIKGAQSVQAAIDANNWNSYFKVPRKWIYPLPEYPAPDKKKISRKNFVLIAEDMMLVNEVKNLSKWKSENLPIDTLATVFALLKLEGLKDAAYIPNLPFAKDGRIAIVDTEYYHRWPVPYKRLCKYLSAANCNYWLTLVEGEEN